MLPAIEKKAEDDRTKHLVFQTTSTISWSFALSFLLSVGFWCFWILVLFYASPSQAAEATPPPYYSSPFMVRGGEGQTYTGWLPTIGEAIDGWWIYYQRVWGVGNGGLSCSYSFMPFSNGAITGTIGNVKLNGDCGGGVNVIGTLQCSRGYTLSGATCIPNGTPKTDKNLGPICPVIGNPITPGIGNKIAVETDYQDAGVFPLRLVRTYNSQFKGAMGLIGNGWTHSYQTSIQVITNSFVFVQRSNGQRLPYALIGGAWITDSDVPWILTQQKNDVGSTTGWTLIAEDDQMETYDASGKLLSIKDRSGITQTLTYSCTTVSATCPVVTPTAIAPYAGLPIQATDSFNRSLNFTYNHMGQMATLTGPDGNIIHYDYNVIGNLVTVTYPDDTPSDLTDNPKKTYVYGELANTANVSQPYALTGIIDENKVRYATYQYNASGKAIASEHAGGIDKYQLSYVANSTRVTDPLNSVYTTNFQTILGTVKSSGQNQPGGSGCTASASSLGYDDNGNIAYRIDFNGNRTHYSYDLARNLETSRTEGLTATGANTPETRTISTEWHPTFRLPVKIIEPGLETAYSYDSRGNMTHKSLKDLVTDKIREWHITYSYSAAGLLLSNVIDGPRTDVADITQYDYYPADAACSGGHPGCRGQLMQYASALGQVTRITRYSAQGQPEEIVDPNGLIITLVYDIRRRLSSLDVGGERTTYSYNPVGLMDRVTQPGGAYLAYRYDDAHRLIGIKDHLNNTLAYTLDAKGNRIKEELFDSNGQLARSQSRVYDALSRLQNLIQVH